MNEKFGPITLMTPDDKEDTEINEAIKQNFPNQENKKTTKKNAHILQQSLNKKSIIQQSIKVNKSNSDKGLPNLKPSLSNERIKFNKKTYSEK